MANLSAAAETHRSLADAHNRLAESDAALLRSQITIAQIPAPTGDEDERGSWVRDRFVDQGLADVTIDSAGNVIGRRPGARDLPPVVVCAHLDTVFPRGTDVSVRHDGNRLIGPGINDNGRGLAVMLALAAEIDGRRVCPELPVEFVATTGEEGAGDLRGAKHYFAGRGRDATAALVLDGAGDERIIHRALGSRRFRVTFSGPGGHSWAAFGAPNAVHAAAFAAARLARLQLPFTPRTTLTVGRIGGGFSINAIPDRAWFEVDLRSTSSDVLDAFSTTIAQVASAGADEENGRRSPSAPALTVQVARIGDRPCGETPADHPLVHAALAATHLVGRRADLTLASTDANIPISRGIPAIAIGGGGKGGDAHTRDEWFENTNGTLGVARALTVVMTAARTQGRGKREEGRETGERFASS